MSRTMPRGRRASSQINEEDISEGDISEKDIREDEIPEEEITKQENITRSIFPLPIKTHIFFNHCFLATTVQYR